jgi:hypothetical protein
MTFGWLSEYTTMVSLNNNVDAVCISKHGKEVFENYLHSLALRTVWRKRQSFEITLKNVTKSTERTSSSDNMVVYLRQGVLSSPPNPLRGRPSLIGCCPWSENVLCHGDKGPTSHGFEKCKQYLCLAYIVITLRSQGCSVGVVSDDGLDDRGSIPNRGRGFFF